MLCVLDKQIHNVYRLTCSINFIFLRDFFFHFLRKLSSNAYYHFQREYKFAKKVWFIYLDYYQSIITTFQRVELFATFNHFSEIWPP